MILDFILLRACLDGRRGEFVGFELYECSGVGWISSQSPIVIEYLYKLLGVCFNLCYYSSRMWLRCIVLVEKFQIVRRTGEMLPKFLRTETPPGRDSFIPRVIRVPSGDISDTRTLPSARGTRRREKIVEKSSTPEF